ncbi:hypothetical protein BDZ94DRAFT_1378540 [Collybia nuda]|uniref:Uncharacterized protein n=1 Tax=Collybia nuda TaxID=64659 RepID=A0A9P6CBZ2_9AGAR|nr:hypothetical protein BDZ94DRAFT_1378540 [Collybia nuda]
MVCYVVGAFLPYNIQEHTHPKFQSGLIFALQTSPTIAIAEAMLILRVYTVFQRNKLILAFLTIIWIVQVSLMIYFLIMIFDSVVASFLTFVVFGTNVVWTIAGFIIHYKFKKVKLSRNRTNADNVFIYYYDDDWAPDP